MNDKATCLEIERTTDHSGQTDRDRRTYRESSDGQKLKL